MKKLLITVFALFSLSAQADQAITCKTYSGATFVYIGFQCPAGSIRTF